MPIRNNQLLYFIFFILFSSKVNAQHTQLQPKSGSLKLEKIGGAKQRNIIFVLTDDHRYDALGFLNTQTFIQTPNLDQLAKNGAYFRNAFVTTSLCSPSRASILTGLYAHNHKVIDNNNPVSESLNFFAQYLQNVGYKTAFIGKWHMGGDSDQPQRGFNHWVSFPGQGVYLPDENGLNINGIKTKQKGYITDELTDYAIDWLETIDREKPFMLYLSHKGVHADFIPPDKYKNAHLSDTFKKPITMDIGSHSGQPMWVQNQRNSWHGIDFPYHSNLNIEAYYKRYAQTLQGVDESLGRVMMYLKEHDLLESTLVIYMGDNGFLFGEHGLIDKRNAYEESMRIPLIAHCPELIKTGTVINDMVANIDIAPTILNAAGLKFPDFMDGKSFFPQLNGLSIPWRKQILYEYYWERNYPQTPTMHAIRSQRYKYIHYHGIWDTDELYDLEVDPHESNNLISDQKHLPIVKTLNTELFDMLKETNGMYLPIYKDEGKQSNKRNPLGSLEAKFPTYLFNK